MNPTIGFLFDGAATRLAQAGLPEPRRDAAELVARVLGISRLAVLVSRRDPAPPAAAARLRQFVARR
ncbi:MAG: protein-(glutamine-N5) methyltransferase, release factor-specific, partial [bacterium]